MYADPQVVLNGGFDQPRATLGIAVAFPTQVGSVDPVKAVAGNPHVEIARDGEEGDRWPFGIHADDDNGIGTPHTARGGLIGA